MAYLTREVATQLCAANIAAMLKYNDVIDIRNTKRAFKLFSCRILDDSCIIIVANSITEAKDYASKCMGNLQWTLANSSTWQEPFKSIKCYAAVADNLSSSKFVLYEIPDNIPYWPAASFKQHIKQILNN